MNDQQIREWMLGTLAEWGQEIDTAYIEMDIEDRGSDFDEITAKSKRVNESIFNKLENNHSTFTLEEMLYMMGAYTHLEKMNKKVIDVKNKALLELDIYKRKHEISVLEKQLKKLNSNNPVWLDED